MRSRLRFVVATVATFSVLTLVWSWPLARLMRTTYLQAVNDTTGFGRPDAMLTSWMLAWASHALRTNPLHLFHANIFHPLPWTFAFSENLLAGALLVTPVDLVWSNPVLDHNVLLLASFVLAGTGTALLVRELGGGVPAAWLAGAIVAFGPFRFDMIGHVHSLSTHWMPFALLAVHRCLRTGRGAIAVALTVLLVSLSSVYYAYFFFIALAVFMTAHWLLGCPAVRGGRSRALAGIAGAAIVTAIMLVPYMIARDIYSLGRNLGEAWLFAARGITYLGGVADLVDYATQRYVARQPVTILIGPATLGLMLVGLAAGAAADRGGRRTTVAYLAMAVALALVSFGPLIQWRGGFDPSVPGPWVLLATVVPGFAALRVSMRACTVVLLAVGVVAAFGAEAMWRRAHRPLARAAVLVLFVVVGVLESWRPPFVRFTVPWAAAGIPPVYRWLAAQPGPGAVAELPIGLPEADSAYMVLSATHWKPLVNGYSGFIPNMPFFRGTFFWFPTPPTLRVLHSLGVRWVVLHPAQMFPGQAKLCEIDPTKIAPYAAIVYHDPTTCVYEIRGAPPAAPTPPDVPVPLDGATVRASAGTDAGAAIDGRLATHWVEAVDSSTETWLQLDLPAPHTITRLVLELGPHFGEYLRQWRIDTSLDGVEWRTITTERTPMPPLLQIQSDPDHLSEELRLTTATPARHVRIVRVSADKVPAFDMWGNWMRWGVHEIRVFEAVP